MKKVIACIMTIILSLMCFCTIAEESKEITFQGVPWFSSPNEVTKLLGKSGFTNGKSFKIHEAKDRDSLSDSHIAKYSQDKEVPYTYAGSKNDEKITKKLLRQWQNNVIKTIAKHEVNFLHAYYTADPKKHQLVEFEMILSNPDGDYDLESVYSALVKAFGEPQAIRDNNEYIWLGANNTIAILKGNHVVFATLDGLEYAETIKLNIDEPEDTGF